jgi:hypothetical protein
MSASSAEPVDGLESAVASCKFLLSRANARSACLLEMALKLAPTHVPVPADVTAVESQGLHASLVSQASGLHADAFMQAGEAACLTLSELASPFMAQAMDAWRALRWRSCLFCASATCSGLAPAPLCTCALNVRTRPAGAGASTTQQGTHSCRAASALPGPLVMACFLSWASIYSSSLVVWTYHCPMQCLNAPRGLLMGLHLHKGHFFAPVGMVIQYPAREHCAMALQDAR